MARSSRQITLLLACWQLGLVTVLLDPRQSRAQLQKAIDAAKPRILWVDQAMDTFQCSNTQRLIKPLLLSPEDLSSLYIKNKGLKIDYPTIKKTDPAYIIYTSGSTGMPKGVVIHHGALSHYCAAITQQLRDYQNHSANKNTDKSTLNTTLNSGDTGPNNSPRWLTLATVAADLGFTSVFAALYLGHRLVLADTELAFNPPALANFLTDCPVDYLKIVPSHLQALLSVENPEKILPQKALILGGEGLERGLYQTINTLAPSLAMINHYGPSETTVGVSTALLSKAPETNRPSQVAPLGSALPGMLLEIRNNSGNIVPHGVIGELYIAGPQVSAGYWHAPELTQRAFLSENSRSDSDINTPVISAQSSDKRHYYRSGDLVRINQHKQIEYLGRSDDQIKRRGYRLELGEVAAWLNSQREVALSSVNLHRQSGQAGADTQYLLAFIELSSNLKNSHDGSETAHRKIAQRMREALPNYMIPDQLLVVDTLPLNDNGKINRQQLLSDFIHGQSKQANAEKKSRSTSATPATSHLVNIWSQLLHIDAVNIKPEDDFFALGGDSILSLQLIAMAKKHKLLLKPLDIINHSRLAAMEALLIDTAWKAQATDSIEKGEEFIRLQNTLIRLFTELLQAQQVLSEGECDNYHYHIDKDSDFFRCGGDSILSLQLIALAHKADIRLTPKMLIQQSTPNGLARLAIENASNNVPAVLDASSPTHKHSIPLLNGSERTQPQPLSASQQRLWFLQQFEPRSTAYNVTQAFNLTGNIIISALSQSIWQLLKKHEILRCRYFEENKQKTTQVYQQLIAIEAFTLPLHIHHLNSQETEKSWLNEIEQASNKVFNLEQADVFAIDLFECRKGHYQLLINLHHIVTDGWSMGLLVQDFIIYYQNFSSDISKNYQEKNNTQPSYLDWVASTNKADSDGLSEALKSYWLKRLDNVNQSITLPLDHAYPAVQSSLGNIFTTELDSRLTAAIDKLAKSQQTTAFTVLLAAFKLLLWRYSGETDFAVGIPVSGRENPDTQNMVGVFINTVASRHCIDPRQGFSDWLSLVHKTNSEDFTRQTLAIETLFDLLGVERQLARPSLFQTLFNYQSDANKQRLLTLPELELVPIAQESVAAKYELSVNLFRQETLSLHIEFARELFEPTTIARIATDYQQLLEQLCQHPHLAIERYSLASMTQPHAGLIAQAVTHKDDFITRFEKTSLTYPDHTALVAKDRSLNYRQLNREANQLAHWLIDQGAKPEQLLAFCLPRDSRLLVTLLAIQKTGAAYLPLDPSQPIERLRYIVEHAQASLCLCDSALMPRFAPLFSDIAAKYTGTKTMSLIDIDSTIEHIKTNNISHSNPELLIHPQNLAYVLYTSGSTGKPKGVQLERRQFANFLRAIEPILPKFTAILALTTITFDIAGLELCLPLATGASVILADEATRTNSKAIAAVVEEHAIDLIQATPAGWTLLQDIAPPPPILRNITALTGGEALDAPLAAFLSRSCKNVINVYGPTETTVWSSSYQLKPSSTSTKATTVASIAIGRPLLNNQCFVLDKNLQKVPTGVAGELYISGHGLARGYQYKAALTADKFLANPFSDKGESLYKTGDKVKWLSDGELHFIGRSDDQIKLRGLRIELGEIEASLLAHKDIKQAAVIVSQEQLIAYIVVEQGTYVDDDKTIDSNGINNSSFNDTAFNNTRFTCYLSTLLPEYMLPQRYQILDAIPLNSNGKIDRKALPKPLPIPSRSHKKRALTDKEAIIASIWQSLLAVDNINPSSHFFELGGHSLLAVQVRARLAEQGFHLALKVLFKYPTLALLAQELGVANKSSNSQAIQPVARERFMPLSSAQQRLWFMQSIQPRDTHFNMSTVLELKGAIDYTRLQRALDAVVTRHEILRTTYHDIDGQGFQQAHQSLAITVTLLKSTEALSSDTQIAQAANTVFDLSKEAPLKVYLYKTQQDEHLCQLVQHHIASDGWSSIILMNELIAAYELASTLQPIALPTLAVQYIDYALWQNAQLNKQQKDIDYWRTQLSGIAPRLSLPFTKKSPSGSAFAHAGDAIDFKLSGELTEKLKQLTRDNQCSLFMVLMAALSTQLHHHTRSQDIVIGTDVANRQQAESEALIGFFVNLIAIRNRPKPTQQLTAYLQQTKERCIDSLEHQQLPFDKVVEVVKPTRIEGVHPIIQALLVVQNMPLSHAYMDDISVTQRLNKQKHSKFDMALFVDEETHEGKPRLALRWVFRSAIFERSAIEFLSTDLQRLLQAMTDKPTSTLAALASKEKRDHIMNNTSTDYHNDKKPINKKMSKISKIKKRKTNMTNTAPPSPD